MVYYQISLCDEYSLPVDFVNKRRPRSFGAAFPANWTTPSPTGDQVEVVETYCDPRDSKAYLEPGEEASAKLYTSPDRDYSQPYTDASSEGKTPEGRDDDGGVYEDVGAPPPDARRPRAPAPVTVNCVTIIRVGSPHDEEELCRAHCASDGEDVRSAPARRNPSPYYYSDLFREAEEATQTSPSLARRSGSSPGRGQHRYRKSASLDTPSPAPGGEEARPKRYSLGGDGALGRYDLLAECLLEWDALLMPPHRAPRGPHRQLPCACADRADDPEDHDDHEDFEAVKNHPQHHHHHHHHHHHKKSSKVRRRHHSSRERTSSNCLSQQVYPEEPPVDYDVPEDEEFGDMSGRRSHLYETAFDCKVSRSDDDLDDVDRVTNHPALLALGARPGQGRLAAQDGEATTLALSQDLGGLALADNEDLKEEASPQLPLRGYSPSPPASAPLPAKFHGSRDPAISGIRSAPHLPSGSPAVLRLKDLRLPVKSLRAREGPDTRIMEFKGRPEAVLRSTGQEVLEFRGRGGVRPKYSSSESMATSSSLESIRSSTSEGNRSTTSSESHRSSSLSSHSSDSAGSAGPPANLYLHHHHHHHHHHHSSAAPLSAGSRFFPHQGNKLHILSPISDKSSQEPASETSDNNRNNNSLRASPEDGDQTGAGDATPTADPPPDGSAKPKRRLPQNKNLINLALQQQSSSGDAEVHGSDSGISIESQGGKCSKGFSFLKLAVQESTLLVDHGGAELSDLPFDMPKLRRRRLLQQDTCTSGSATSVDLHDLPFDMPKLRRRLRGQSPEAQTSTESSGVSQASSSQSVRDSGPGRSGLTLHLETGRDAPKQRQGLSLNLGGKARGGSSDDIDVSQPLERQGWYHGAITRTEAENILRILKEGSFLVRNSESTRQDFSLSLKSARGFMHMRIQQDPGTGKFILGQFSQPFDSVPDMIRHYSVNRLPIRGAEHMCLLHPVIEQLL